MGDIILTPIIQHHTCKEYRQHVQYYTILYSSIPLDFTEIRYALSTAYMAAFLLDSPTITLTTELSDSIRMVLEMQEVSPVQFTNGNRLSPSMVQEYNTPTHPFTVKSLKSLTWLLILTYLPTPQL